LDEQERFLSWLRGAIADNAVDTLVVAGDIFDSMQPSAEAQAVYYRFLADVGRSGLRQVVIVGGNHDSPTRLDAPAELLRVLAVHVVGGYPSASDLPAHEMIVPLKARGSDEVAAVCLAVPYVHEYRLGVRTTMVDADEARARFREAFAKQYRDLVDAAREKYGDVPIMATGHLTVGKDAEASDAPREIHQVGTLDALPLDVLDARLSYVALGHIHRAYPVRVNPPAWYSGSPVAYSLKESESKRVVLLVDLADLAGETKVTRMEVPAARKLVQVRGTRDEVVVQLKGLTWTEELPPLVHVRVDVEQAEPGLNNHLYEAVAAHPEDARPALVEIKQARTGAAPLEADQHLMGGRSLAEVTPSEVFALLCAGAGPQDAQAREALLDAFKQLEHATPDVLDAMVHAVELPFEGVEDSE
jgi:exonuclease SbcD